MATIYTKVHEYNKETHTVVASFASNMTKSQNPNDHEKLNFDIANLVEEGASEQDLKDALALAGLSWCTTYCKKEMLDDKPEKQTEVENLVGTTWSQEASDQPPPVPAKLDIDKLKVDLGL